MCVNASLLLLDLLAAFVHICKVGALYLYTYTLYSLVHEHACLHASTHMHTCSCQHSVKHYRILWDGKQFTFGLGKFPDLESLKQHFDNQPVISGESGNQLILCYKIKHFVVKFLVSDTLKGIRIN